MEAASRGVEPSRIALALAPERRLDTLAAVLIAAGETAIVAVGAPGMDAAVAAGLGVIVFLMNLAFGLYIFEHHRKDIVLDRQRVLVIQGLTLLAFVLAKVFVVLDWPIHLYPLGLFGIAFSIAQGQRFAIVWCIFVAVAVGLMKGAPGFHFPVAFTLAGGAAIGMLILGPHVSNRRKVIRAGICMGVAFAVLIFATEVLLRGRADVFTELSARPREVALALGFGLLNGLFTGYFMVEFGLRFVEAAFDVVTDLRLQELADLNQPILKKFAMEAPGTFHHSQMVGTLAEAAAAAIGANPLLCRVGAHFHDMGKMAKPEYYIENITAGGATKHDGLTPSMSTLIIVSHVKDGVEMAEELGLPPQIIDCIPEHHGTIAVEFFYHQAVKQQKREGGPEPSKDDFRYPGPKPQTRETAILMIADSVEAISRVLTEPNPTRIEQMVHEVVLRRLQESQFDECAITLAELHRVEEAMVRVLLGIFHGRIKYPKATGLDRRAEADLAEEAPVGAGAFPAGAGGAEDTASRIRVAAIQADGPGVPLPRTPPPAPAADPSEDAPPASASKRLGARF